MGRLTVAWDSGGYLRKRRPRSYERGYGEATFRKRHPRSYERGYGGGCFRRRRQRSYERGYGGILVGKSERLIWGNSAVRVGRAHSGLLSGFDDGSGFGISFATVCLHGWNSGAGADVLLHGNACLPVLAGSSVQAILHAEPGAIVGQADADSHSAIFRDESCSVGRHRSDQIEIFRLQPFDSRLRIEGRAAVRGQPATGQALPLANLKRLLLP